MDDHLLQLVQNQIKSTFVPFLSPPNSPWPLNMLSLPEPYRFGTLTRPVNSAQTDIIISHQQTDLIRIECKDFQRLSIEVLNDSLTKATAPINFIVSRFGEYKTVSLPPQTILLQAILTNDQLYLSPPNWRCSVSSSSSSSSLSLKLIILIPLRDKEQAKRKVWPVTIGNVTTKKPKIQSKEDEFLKYMEVVIKDVNQIIHTKNENVDNFFPNDIFKISKENIEKLEINT
jgi:hypothetical protein